MSELDEGLPITEEGPPSPDVPSQPPLDIPPDPSTERVAEAPEGWVEPDEGEPLGDAENGAEGDTEPSEA